MKEKATIFDYARICKANNSCLYCPLGIVNTKINTQHCAEFISVHTEKANKIILKWCEEHPVETRQDRFLKMFPNAKINPNGVITCCPQKVDKTVFCEGKRCLTCMRAYWLAEVDENE